MPDQIVPTPVNATTPQANTGNDQSLDDILNELEKQYNITPPGQEKAASAPVAPATPVKPMEANIPTPPPVKPLTEPPKFEVKEHTISAEPKVDKVKPTMPPTVEKTEIVKPAAPVQDKGAGFEALEQTKKTMPNEFDAAPVAKPVEPPKAESVPPMAPPPKKGGVSNVAKILGGVVGVLMLVAGTFAVNKLVTQPQDIRQQASSSCPGSDNCSPPAGTRSFCKGNVKWEHDCVEGPPGNFCWDAASEHEVENCADGNQVCANGNCVDPSPQQCESSNCPFIQGPGNVGGTRADIHYCDEGLSCRIAPDSGVCARACDGGTIISVNNPIDDGCYGIGTNGLNLPCECYSRQIDYYKADGTFAGYKLFNKTRNDCTPQTSNAASCTAKKAYLANGCTTTDCPSKTSLAADAYIRRGDIILYELVVTTTSGTAENPVITDTLDNNFTYITGDPGCTRNANVVTCTKGSSLANGQTWSPKILVELTGRMGIGTTPPLPENLPNIATFASSNAGTNTCNINLKSTNSIICTSLTLSPESPQPSTTATATCLSNPTAAFYRFRRTNEAGTFVEIAPTATNAFVFTANASGNTIVQCSPCRTSDVSTCSPYEDVANLNGGAPGVCTKVIAPLPPVLACVGLSINPRLPKLGDNVTITCGDASDLGANRYEFGYTTAELAPDNPRRVWIDVQPAAPGSLVSSPINISSSGTYSVRCRACKDAACTNWDIL